MKVQFRSNLGQADAKSFGLDYKECTYEAEVDVAEDVGKTLIEKGFADAVTLKAPAKAPAVKGA